MNSGETKHVQTELSDEEYRRFRQFANERGLTLKEAGREAVRVWIERQRRPDPADRAFTILDELPETMLPDSAETDARTADDLIEEWDGEDTFVLANLLSEDA